MGMETGRLSTLDSLELVLKAIQNVKEEQMVKISCRGKVVVGLLSMLPQNGKNITDLHPLSRNLKPTQKVLCG